MASASLVYAFEQQLTACRTYQCIPLIIQKKTPAAKQIIARRLLRLTLNRHQCVVAGLAQPTERFLVDIPIVHKRNVRRKVNVGLYLFHHFGQFPDIIFILSQLHCHDDLILSIHRRLQVVARKLTSFGYHYSGISLSLHYSGSVAFLEPLSYLLKPCLASACILQTLWQLIALFTAVHLVLSAVNFLGFFQNLLHSRKSPLQFRFAVNTPA